MAVDTSPQALTGPATRRSRPARRGPTGERSTPYLFIAPFFILFAIFGLFPIIYNGVVALRH